MPLLVKGKLNAEQKAQRHRLVEERDACWPNGQGEG